MKLFVIILITPIKSRQIELTCGLWRYSTGFKDEIVKICGCCLGFIIGKI